MLSKCYKIYKSFQGIDFNKTYYFVWAEKPQQAKKILARRVDFMVDAFACTRYPLFDGMFSEGTIHTSGEIKNGLTTETGDRI